MRSHLQSRIPFSRHLQVRVFRSLEEVYIGVPSPARARFLSEIRFLSTEVWRKKVLKIFQSFYGYFFYGSCFFIFLFRLFWFLFWRMNGTKHIGRKPWFRTKDRITVLHKGIYSRQVKIPKFFQNVPCGRRKRWCSIRIIFTKLGQDMFLIGGIIANVNRFQRNTPSNQKVCFGVVETIYLIN